MECFRPCMLMNKSVTPSPQRRAYKRPVLKPKAAPDPVSQQLAALKEPSTGSWFAPREVRNTHARIYPTMPFGGARRWAHYFVLFGVHVALLSVFDLAVDPKKNGRGIQASR